MSSTTHERFWHAAQGHARTNLRMLAAYITAKDIKSAAELMTTAAADAGPAPEGAFDGPEIEHFLHDSSFNGATLELFVGDVRRGAFKA